MDRVLNEIREDGGEQAEQQYIVSTNSATDGGGVNPEIDS
jgi:hypothetical protein